MDSDSNSTDDDDIYVSSAARLNALKKKAPIIPCESPTSVKDDEETDFWSAKTPVPVNKSKVIQTSTVPSQHHLTRNRRAKQQPSPDVQVEATIELDDDDTEDVIPNNSFDSLNCSQDFSTGIDDDNYIEEVKVRWKSRGIVRLEIRKYESFQKVFQHFAEKEGVSEKQILLLRKNKPILRTDTPASLNLKVIDILEGGIVNAPMVSQEQVEDTENMCKIKVQMSTKQKIVVDLKMDETFKKVVMTCAQELNVEPSQIKLSFDGDEILVTDTPESLDLDQEACIDLRVLSS